MTNSDSERRWHCGHCSIPVIDGERVDQKVLGVLTGQVPVDSMPIAAAAPEPEEDDDETGSE